MGWFTLFMVVLVILRLAAQLALEALNRMEARRNAMRCPDALAEGMDAATYARSVHYTVAKSRFGSVQAAYDAAVLLALLFSGALPWLWARLDGLAPGKAWSGALFLVVTGIVLGLLGLPFEWWSRFRLEGRFGFNNSTLGLWAADQIKYALLGLVIGFPLMWRVLALVVGWPVTAKKTSSRSGVWIDRLSMSMVCWSSWASRARRVATVPSPGTCKLSVSSSRPALVRRCAAVSRCCGSVNCRRMCPPGTRALSCSGLPSATRAPWSSTATRSASWSASSRYCVVNRIVTPSAARPRMICHMVWRPRGSSPVVGSSRKTIRGAPTRVMARSRRRRIPPE